MQRVVNVYIRNGLTSQYNAGDMMQEGTIALIRAAEKYQPSKGFRFSTYAMFWIRAAVKRSQLAQSREINVPAKVFDTHRRLELTKKLFQEKEGRAPTMQEISLELGIKERSLSVSVQAMSQRVYSLDASIVSNKKVGSRGGAEDIGSLLHYVESKADDFDDAFDTHTNLYREDLLRHLHNTLSPDKAEMVILRYGLAHDENFGTGLSIADLAKKLDVKQDKVRRQLKNTLRALRPHLVDDWVENG